MEALAKLPVFWALEGKRAIVGGGSDAAAWKAELLAACGARVEVYANSLSPGFMTLLERHWEATDGRIVHVAACWQAAEMHGAAMAVADCHDEVEALAFFEQAMRAGVPVNVIDKPKFCQFQFGSIINRSPVVVAVSTDGAAPILAQTIRRKIEAILPTNLKSWAKLALSMREHANRVLPEAAAKRSFWENFSDMSLGGTKADEGAAYRLVTKIANSRTRGAGKVTLVGAGTGDPELLTLKAVRAMQSADVILFDDLVSDEVLELSRREAKRMLVGKRGGRVSCSQQDINETMISLARSGKHVVRLKSGDPMVFGRAGEEIAVLEENGISVDIVPGITSASAMASRLGVSLTHRDHAQSLRLVTGHSRNGDLPGSLDWTGMADGSTTTVFYMGGRTASLIKARLLGAGMSPETAVAVASALTRTNETLWKGKLSQLDDAISEIGFEQPILIGVGKVFSGARTALAIPVHLDGPMDSEVSA
ncbi:siroheme synthase CysG [Rhizobium rhizogenes]|uniref:siroheme synthase CysG n=1 Tax=Rhizobium rhizogenes TaxID=359 RepID=UPI0015D4F332|nr:siroheme synthase CysG [Rhizobium rhizogenes]